MSGIEAKFCPICSNRQGHDKEKVSDRGTNRVVEVQDLRHRFGVLVLGLRAQGPRVQKLRVEGLGVRIRGADLG